MPPGECVSHSLFFSLSYLFLLLLLLLPLLLPPLLLLLLLLLLLRPPSHLSLVLSTLRSTLPSSAPLLFASLCSLFLRGISSLLPLPLLRHSVYLGTPKVLWALNYAPPIPRFSVVPSLPARVSAPLPLYLTIPCLPSTQHGEFPSTT